MDPSCSTTPGSNHGNIHFEKLLQQELSKMFSSDCQSVSQVEITPFVAIMQLIKAEFSMMKPEVYKTIIAILHDYNPNLGDVHREKTIKYVRLLLDTSPQLADLLVNILPPVTPISRSQVSGATVRPSDPTFQTTTTVSSKGATETATAVKPKSIIVKKSDSNYFNYTPPVVSAYVASKGIPAKVTTVNSTLTSTESRSLSISQTNFPIVAFSKIGNSSTMSTVMPIGIATTGKDFGNARIMFKKELERRTGSMDMSGLCTAIKQSLVSTGATLQMAKIPLVRSGLRNTKQATQCSSDDADVQILSETDIPSQVLMNNQTSCSETSDVTDTESQSGKTQKRKKPAHSKSRKAASKLAYAYNVTDLEKESTKLVKLRPQAMKASQKFIACTTKTLQSSTAFPYKQYLTIANGDQPSLEVNPSDKRTGGRRKAITPKPATVQKNNAPRIVVHRSSQKSSGSGTAPEDESVSDEPLDLRVREVSNRGTAMSPEPEVCEVLDLTEEETDEVYDQEVALDLSATDFTKSR